MGLLAAWLRRFVRRGDLTLIDAQGRPESFGDGSAPRVVGRITDRAQRGILADPALGLGEAYMDGGLTFEEGGVADLLTIVGLNDAARPRRGGALKRLTKPLRRRLQQANDRLASRRNVAHHYDLSNDLYRRFLDGEMQYSCAWFGEPDMTLEAAQTAKLRRLAAKLHLSPGQRVLDIGCGWGGLSLHLASEHGVEVTGVTLSTEQLALARECAAAEGLADRVRFSLTDYRDVSGPFDRIVSVGMFEHVGAPHYDGFFRDVARLLTDDGLAVIHAIGRSKGPGATNAFTRKYVFPGGYIPALSEVLPSVERARLRVGDVEVLRGWHYAETLRHWRMRFMAQRDWAVGAYDERFARMWEFYLASAEMGFRYGGHMVWQMQLGQSDAALPLTRSAT